MSAYVRLWTAGLGGSSAAGAATFGVDSGSPKAEAEKLRMKNLGVLRPARAPFCLCNSSRDAELV
jgi:hypothetical protein